MSDGLDSGVALITGAGSGIGRATAIAFAASGADVVLVGRRQEALEATRDLLPDQPARRALVVPADVSDPVAAERMVSLAVERFGRLDAAANCAAVIGMNTPIFDMAVEEFDAVLNINLRGLWLSLRHEMAAMRESGGAIVNVSSVNAMRAANLPYSTSKAGVEGLTRAAASQGGSYGIRVNALRSGAIWTAMLDEANSAGGRREVLESAFAGSIPLGRIGDTGESAAAIVWLCSPMSSYVTGTCLEVDGGMMAV